MAMLKYVVALALLVVAVQACTHNGITYKVGEKYQDDCNMCTCTAKGNGACHKMACPPKACREGLRGYGAGERYLHSDGCNTCTCTATGASMCSRKACL